MVVARADSLPFLTLTLQVIAVVMDVFTDIDIFRDLQEICRKQGVAVYILLDQALLSQFLDMCMDLKVHPEQEKVCVTLCLISPQSKIGPIYRAVGSGIPIIREGTEAMSKVIYLPEVSQKRNGSQDSKLGPSLTSCCLLTRSLTVHVKRLPWMLLLLTVVLVGSHLIIMTTIYGVLGTGLGS